MYLTRVAVNSNVSPFKYCHPWLTAFTYLTCTSPCKLPLVLHWAASRHSLLVCRDLRTSPPAGRDLVALCSSAVTFALVLHWVGSRCSPLICHDLRTSPPTRQDLAALCSSAMTFALVLHWAGSRCSLLVCCDLCTSPPLGRISLLSARLL